MVEALLLDGFGTVSEDDQEAWLAVARLVADDAEDVPMHGFQHSLALTLPPLGALFIRPESSSSPATIEPSHPR